MEGQITLRLDVEDERSAHPESTRDTRIDEEAALRADDSELAFLREQLLSEREHFRQMTCLAVMPDMATYYSDECAVREAQLDRLFPSWRSEPR